MAIKCNVASSVLPGHGHGYGHGDDDYLILRRTNRRRMLDGTVAWRGVAWRIAAVM